MVIGALASLLIPRGDVRNIVGCAVVGLTLWITGVIILYLFPGTSALRTEGTVKVS
jgi:hypothetical protein